MLFLLQGGAEKGIVPTGYIGVPANLQQFVGNQTAFRPSIVYMVPVCQYRWSYMLSRIFGEIPQALENQISMIRK